MIDEMIRRIEVEKKLEAEAREDESAVRKTFHFTRRTLLEELKEGIEGI